MTTAARKRARGARKVREGSAEPHWLSREVLEVVHAAQLREHGGSSGIRDEAMLDSVLKRARTRWAGERDPSALAAAYAFGIAKNHAFVDGNKRSAFTAAAVFLAMNGVDLVAPEPEVVDVMNRLASGRFTESAFAQWVHAHLERL